MDFLKNWRQGLKDLTEDMDAYEKDKEDMAEEDRSFMDDVREKIKSMQEELGEGGENAGDQMNEMKARFEENFAGLKSKFYEWKKKH